jgi:hypothetical protein
MLTDETQIFLQTRIDYVPLAPALSPFGGERVVRAKQDRVRGAF